jgi:aldehyde dehydrogenase (NAD+)
MSKTYTHTFDTPAFKGTVEIPLGNFIDGKFVDGSEGKTIECVYSAVHTVALITE